MKKTIYKYVLNEQTITFQIAKDAKILACQFQGDNICIWAEVNLENETESRSFSIVGTGHPLSEYYEQLYIGTVQEPPYVWHIYENRK